jgi:hypothetical protein
MTPPARRAAECVHVQARTPITPARKFQTLARRACEGPRRRVGLTCQVDADGSNLHIIGPGANQGQQLHAAGISGNGSKVFIYNS